jgi:hypothetical protein
VRYQDEHTMITLSVLPTLSRARVRSAISVRTTGRQPVHGPACLPPHPSNAVSLYFEYFSLISPHFLGKILSGVCVGLPVFVHFSVSINVMSS